MSVFENVRKCNLSYTTDRNMECPYPFDEQVATSGTDEGAWILRIHHGIHPRESSGCGLWQQEVQTFLKEKNKTVHQ